MDTKVSFKGYMAWNYDREERDLDRMSEQGWQLDSESLEELLKRWKKLAYLLSALSVSLLGLYVALGINFGYLSPVLIIIYVGMFCWIQWGIHQLKKKLLGEGIN